MGLIRSMPNVAPLKFAIWLYVCTIGVPLPEFRRIPDIAPCWLPFSVTADPVSFVVIHFLKMSVRHLKISGVK